MEQGKLNGKIKLNILGNGKMAFKMDMEIYILKIEFMMDIL